jgi:arylformamidase
MIYDISVTISTDTPVYEGDPGIVIKPASSIAAGDSANVSLLQFGAHTGTHVDPPSHFYNDGVTVDQLPLDVLVGECLVCPIENADAIGVDELESANIPEKIERILFKTKNSNLWGDSTFHRDFVYLSPEGADWLLDRGIKLIGIDYLSIEKFHSGTHATHLRLLGHGVIVVEGLNLEAVSGGEYTLVCLPLKIKAGDGAPARAILIK